METNCAPLIDDSFSVVVMNPNLKLIKSTDFFFLRIVMPLSSTHMNIILTTDEIQYNEEQNKYHTVGTVVQFNRNIVRQNLYP